MPVYELYSIRLRRERGDAPDVLTYTAISAKLRVQFGFIVRDLLEDPDEYDNGAYERVVLDLRRSFGRNELVSKHLTLGRELMHFIENGSPTEVLDAMDMILRIVSEVADGAPARSEIRRKVDAAILEFNERCRLEAFGYAFENGGMLRVDSQLLHAEAVKPALIVLSDPAFANADAEFRNAHDHWKAGKSSEVLVDCLKAFESVMKVIAHQRGWSVPDKPTASQLVKVMFDNNLVPSFYQSQLAGLRSTLESGIPTPRNRAGGHGAGPGPEPDVPAELVRYVLHLTAATIIFLVDAHKARP